MRARHPLEQVLRDDDVIHMPEAVLHLRERTKVRLRLLLRVKGPKKIRCISEFFQGDPQLVTLFGRKFAEITSELERRIVPLPQYSACQLLYRRIERFPVLLSGLSPALDREPIAHLREESGMPEASNRNPRRCIAPLLFS